MALVKFLFPRLRRLLLSVLIVYWVILLAYSITNYLQGGSTRVLAWYQHVNGNIFE
jgi:hypothetical protein